MEREEAGPTTSSVRQAQSWPSTLYETSYGTSSSLYTTKVRLGKSLWHREEEGEGVMDLGYYRSSLDPRVSPFVPSFRCRSGRVPPERRGRG